MLKDRELRLLFTALKISGILNSVLIIRAFFTDYSKPLSGLDKAMNDLGRPGWLMAQRLMPGHDLGPALLGIMCSVVLYAAVIWIVLLAGAVIWRRNSSVA
jgi:hypothetical protein